MIDPQALRRAFDALPERTRKVFWLHRVIEAEQRMQRAAETMAERERHRVTESGREGALARAAERGLDLSGEQRAAFDHATDGRGLSVVVGYAGTGKSAMLGVAREAWESAGLNVRGAALSGIAAEGLENGSGIGSRTIASMEHGWSQGRELLTAGDVLVIDEAGMVGTRQMERVLSHAADTGAKVVLVGDPQQLQSIEAGAAFRSIHERHGGVEITEVRRQRSDWQRDATRHLATGRTGEAIRDYGEHGMVHPAATRDDARGDLVDRWDRARQANPNDTRIILTHTNEEVRDLNETARGRMRDAGEHRDGVELHYGRDDFADQGKLVRTLSRERAKDMASDYSQADPARTFAERRGITFRERVAEIVRNLPEKARGIFDNFKPKIPTPREQDMFADFRPERQEAAKHEPARAGGPRGAVERYAKALDEIERMRESRLAAMPHQREALERAREALDAIRPHASTDLRAVFQHSPELVREAAEGRSQATMRAMQLEAEIRNDPFQRADKFVEGWQQLQRHREDLQRDGDFRGARKVGSQMAGMAKSLERDAQVESLLRGRRHELGIDADMGRNLSRDLADHVSFEPTRSLGISR